MRNTRRLAKSEWATRAAPARDRIFASLDPYGEPFTAAAKERALLFPISYELEPAQLAVLRRAAQLVGDDAFYLELLVAAEGEPYWQIPLRDKKPYKRLDHVMDNAIFSPSGQWGMLISDQDHAVLGGAPDFMAVMAAEFPPTEEPAQHFWGPSQSSAEEVFEEVLAEKSPEDSLERLTEASSPIPMRAGEPFGDSQALAFIEFWKVFRDAKPTVGEWLRRLLAHVYGVEHAQRLLQAAGW